MLPAELAAATEDKSKDLLYLLMSEPHSHAVQAPHWPTAASITGSITPFGKLDVSFVDVTSDTILNLLKIKGKATCTVVVKSVTTVRCTAVDCAVSFSDLLPVSALCHSASLVHGRPPESSPSETS